MEIHRFTAHTGQPLELDICYACQGLWIDQNENLKLPAQAVVELFGLLHRHRSDERRPLQSAMACPRCTRSLAQGFDVVRSGRYMTYRCASRHGRFSTFASFMVEKGFVRHMTQAEITDLAQRVGAVYCTSCGAPVDIRKDHACPYCRAAFSLLDPEAVSKALEGYARTRATGETGSPVDIADALIVIERDRNRAERERQQKGLRSMGQSASSHELTGDLLAAGVELVWRTLFR
jgi:rubrerythrin